MESTLQGVDVSAIPVTIVTGFLGAGKTTLLRHVLASPHGLKIAVIQNELSAAAGLEASTMVGPDGERFEKWLELANGCVCCEVRDELAKGIETLMAAKGAFDYVLVETTGMADPGPVAESLWLDTELESPLRLDGIVAIVDAPNYATNSNLLEFCRQLGSADVILLNKLDAVQSASSSEDLAAAEVDRLHEHLRELNGLAPIVNTTRSVVPLESILNLHAFGSRPPPALAAGAKPFAFAAARNPSSDALSSLDGTGRTSLHRDPTFGAITLEIESGKPLDGSKFDALLALLFWEPDAFAEHWHTDDDDASAAAAAAAAAAEGDCMPCDAKPTPSIFRAKGMVDIAGSENVHTLQAVHSTFELLEAAPWGEVEGQGVPRATRLTFIGRHLERASLERAVRSCISEPT